ncbi:unnamed protein product [Cunninghamella blakesleeana]
MPPAKSYNNLAQKRQRISGILIQELNDIILNFSLCTTKNEASKLDHKKGTPTNALSI